MPIDLEAALMLGGAPRTFIGSDNETNTAIFYLLPYLEQHFELSVNGQVVKPTFIGKETTVDGLATWVYLEAPVSGAPTRITVRYDALTELHFDQRNMIRVIGPEEAYKTLLLHQGSPSGEVVFN